MSYMMGTNIVIFCCFFIVGSLTYLEVSFRFRVGCFRDLYKNKLVNRVYWISITQFVYRFSWLSVDGLLARLPLKN